MDDLIVKTVIIKENPNVKVLLEEMQDGRRQVRKSSSRGVSLFDEEWNALCFLYNTGFNVPKPYKNDEQGMCMQYIDNGLFWDNYQAANAGTQQALMDKFVTLLHDLHRIKPNSPALPGGFIKNELVEIEAIIKKKQIDNLWGIFNKLQALSANINESPSCYLHRDYHVWNVLTDKNNKLYLVDLELKQGDYRFDVGWTYMLQSRSAVHDARHGAIAQAFLSGYFKLNPAACEDIEYFKQLANLRWLVNVTPDNKSDRPWFPEMMAIAEQAIAAFLKC